jgi:hypothetical protein
VVTFQTGKGTHSTLSGFTIQHGSATFGAGVTLSGASATITRNVFRNNAQGAVGFGAAIGGNGSSAIIERNTFQTNTWDTQFNSGVVSSRILLHRSSSTTSFNGIRVAPSI